MWKFYPGLNLKTVLDHRIATAFISRHLTVLSDNIASNNEKVNDPDIILSLKKPRLLRTNPYMLCSKDNVEIDMKLYCLDAHFLFVHIQIPCTISDKEESIIVILSCFLDSITDKRLIVHGLSKDIIQLYENINWEPFFDTYFDVSDGIVQLDTEHRFFVL